MSSHGRRREPTGVARTPHGAPAAPSVDEAALHAVLRDLAAMVTREFTAQEVLVRLADAAARVLPADGVAALVDEGGRRPRVVRTTEPRTEALASTEELVRDGPSRTALTTWTVVSDPDLREPGDWPQFRRRATELGLRSVTAVPLRARGRIWGTLEIYRGSAGRLDRDALDTASTLAEIAASYLVIAADRDDAREYEAELADRAMHDPMTGLPVRWVFHEQLTHALAVLQRRASHLGVLFIDVDGLKYVNDTYGHLAGDDLLRTCAARIRAALRPSDILARIGGDEFVVLLEDLKDVDAASAIVKRVLGELVAPHDMDGNMLRPSASIGIAVTDDPHVGADTLISHADAAMYRAKHGGRGGYRAFDPAEYAAASRRGQVADELATAITGGELELHYQPIIDLQTGSAYAVEALLRWRHPSRGLLTAAQFLDAAEHGPLMCKIGGWVLPHACAQMAAWDRELGSAAPARISVNVSAAEFTQTDIEQRVRDALAAESLDPERLVLEITETGILAEPTAARSAIDGLRELGCELAIDDFGTGYSSLSRLVQIPAAALKIDQSFTRVLTGSAESLAVVSSVLLLGHNLRRGVIVEGVEDAATLELLQELGCDYAQGYHLAMPQSAAQIAALLAHSGPAR